MDKIKWLFQGLSFVSCLICFVGFQDVMFLGVAIVNAMMLECMSPNEDD